MDDPLQFNLYLQSSQNDRRSNSMANGARIILTGIAGTFLILALLSSKLQNSEGEVVLDQIQGSSGETIKVKVPDGASSGQILRVVVPGHSGTIYAKIPQNIVAGNSFLVKYAPPPSGSSTVLPTVVGSDSPALAEESSPDFRDDIETVSGMTSSLQHRSHTSSLTNFMEPANPRDWRDTWTDPDHAKNMEIDDVLQNSAEMVNQVKQMYQSARNKYSEYRQLSAAAAKAYARVTKAIRKAQLGGYVLGIKSPFPLPPDWQAATDPQNRIYYINSKTGSTSWNPPGYEVLTSEVSALKKKLAQLRLEALARSQYFSEPQYMAGTFERNPAAVPVVMDSVLPYSANSVLPMQGAEGRVVMSSPLMGSAFSYGRTPFALQPNGGQPFQYNRLTRRNYAPAYISPPRVAASSEETPFIVDSGEVPESIPDSVEAPATEVSDPVEAVDSAAPMIDQGDMPMTAESVPDADSESAPESVMQPAIETQAAYNGDMLYYQEPSSAEEPEFSPRMMSGSLPALKPLRFPKQALRMLTTDEARQKGNEPLRVAIKDRTGLPVSSGYVLDR